MSSNVMVSTDLFDYCELVFTLYCELVFIWIFLSVWKENYVLIGHSIVDADVSNRLKSDDMPPSS